MRRLLFLTLGFFANWVGTSWSLVWMNGTSTNRPKRVIPGYEITSSAVTDYEVTKYIVWLGYPRTCSSWLRYTIPGMVVRLFGLTGTCISTNNELVCGGALLTPWIVGTACHCVADFVGHKENGWTFAMLQNHFLTHYEVYAGRLDTSDFNEHYAKSNAYYIHEKCSKLSARPGYLTHDFGFIVLASAIDDKSSQARYDITYAPAYPESELKHMSIEVQNKEMICLFFGWGAWGKLVNLFDDDSEASKILRYGWAITFNQESCFWYSQYYWDNLRFAYNHEEIASFACQIPFGIRKGAIGNGDSGSPITCGREYFGLVSAGAWQTIEVYKTKFGTRSDPDYYMQNERLAAALFFYASEWRLAFIQTMKMYGGMVKAIRKSGEYSTNPELKKLQLQATAQMMARQPHLMPSWCSVTFSVLVIFLRRF